MAGKKVCLQGNIPAGKYSRGFRKNNKNSRVFPHKNISLYSNKKKKKKKSISLLSPYPHNKELNFQVRFGLLAFG